MESAQKKFSMLLCCNGLSNLGHFSIYPLLAIYFINTLHLSIEVTSFILLFAAIILRLSRIIFIPIMNCISLKYLMFFSMLFCSIGYLGLSHFRDLYLIIIFLFLVGTGYGTNSLIIRSVTSFLKNGTALRRYAVLNMITNLSAAIGPCIGNFLLIHYPQSGLCLFPAVIFLIASIIILFFPHIEHLDHSSTSTIDIYKIIFSKKIGFLLAISTMTWFLIAQFFSLLPLYIVQGLHSQHLLALIYLLNALVIVVFSIPISKFLSKNATSLGNQLLIFFSLFFSGLILLYFQNNLVTLAIAVILWSTGETIVTPALNVLTVNMTSHQSRLAGFGINVFAMGLGEGIGNFAGVMLAGYSTINGQWEITFGTLSIIAFLFLCFLLTNFTRKELITSGE